MGKSIDGVSVYVLQMSLIWDIEVFYNRIGLVVDEVEVIIDFTCPRGTVLR